MSYDPQVLLASVDQNMAQFTALGTAAMVFNYIYFFTAIVNGRRDRAFTFPLVCSTIWFAHDLSYLLLYDQWFHVYKHWYVERFWYGLVPTTLFEIFFIYQAWQYGKDEIMPKASRTAFTGYVLLAVVSGLVFWAALKYFLADPIYAYAFGATGVIAPIFVIARMLRRGDAKGQSVLLWASYVGMQSSWFTATILYFGPDFRTPWYLAMVALSILGGVAATILCHRMKREARIHDQHPGELHPAH